MRRLLIDSDTGSDDAVALIMALKNPDVRVEAITIVGGNVPMAQGLQNACYTVELCGADVPVHAGLAKPLLRELETAQNVHGEDGMGDIGLPLQGYEPAAGHAVEVILRTLKEHAGEITLVALGPLSNIAIALSIDPGIANKVGHCLIMGGTSDNQGNVSPAAEYNFWADPEAAKLVFESGMPITMIGWDISRKYAVITTEEEGRLRAAGTPLADFCIDIQGVLKDFVREHTRMEGFSLPDPIAMAVALDPEVVLASQQLFVTVESGDGLCRGVSVIDHENKLGQVANTRVVLEASKSRFLELLHGAVN